MASLRALSPSSEPPRNLKVRLSPELEAFSFSFRCCTHENTSSQRSFGGVRSPSGKLARESSPPSESSPSPAPPPASRWITRLLRPCTLRAWTPSLRAGSSSRAQASAWPSEPDPGAAPTSITSPLK